MGVKILGVQFFFWGGGFWTSQKFRFPTIIIFVIFWTRGKDLLDYLEKKYSNIG